MGTADASKLDERSGFLVPTTLTPSAWGQNWLYPFVTE
jgi:hypothetical protein